MNTNTNNAADDKILSRIKKMMALANDDAASEHERDTALQMSYKLLAKYNLSMAHLDAFQHAKDDPRDNYRTETYSMIWSKNICNIVSDLFFCKYYFGGKINAYKCYHHFVGRESNATTAMYISEYIINSIVKEVRAKYGHALIPPARAFALGVVSKLQQRVKELKRQQEQEEQAVPGTALVLANLYESEKSANALVIAHIKLSPGRAGKATPNIRAFDAGSKFGENVSLSPQIAESKTNTRRIQ
jgi:hypothetical protein